MVDNSEAEQIKETEGMIMEKEHSGYLMGNLDYGGGQLESLSYACEKEYIAAGRLEAIGRYRRPG